MVGTVSSNNCVRRQRIVARIPERWWRILGGAVDFADPHRDLKSGANTFDDVHADDLRAQRAQPSLLTVWVVSGAHRFGRLAVATIRLANGTQYMGCAPGIGSQVLGCRSHRALTGVSIPASTRPAAAWALGGAELAHQHRPNSAGSDSATVESPDRDRIFSPARYLQAGVSPPTSRSNLFDIVRISASFALVDHRRGSAATTPGAGGSAERDATLSTYAINVNPNADPAQFTCASRSTALGLSITSSGNVVVAVIKTCWASYVAVRASNVQAQMIGLPDSIDHRLRHAVQFTTPTGRRRDRTVAYRGALALDHRLDLDRNADQPGGRLGETNDPGQDRRSVAYRSPRPDA